MLQSCYRQYAERVQELLKSQSFDSVHQLSLALHKAWEEGRRVFICGNGGSAANAMHMANDLLYGVSQNQKSGLRVMALTADSSVMTCLANDLSYSEIFSRQLISLAEKEDVLIALSGSGNSKNIVQAIRTGREIGMRTFAILGYSGGECLNLADTAIHFAIEDMQIAEDMQLIVGHMIMRWLRENPVGA